MSIHMREKPFLEAGDMAHWVKKSTCYTDVKTWVQIIRVWTSWWHKSCAFWCQEAHLTSKQVWNYFPKWKSGAQLGKGKERGTLKTRVWFMDCCVWGGGDKYFKENLGLKQNENKRTIGVTWWEGTPSCWESPVEEFHTRLHPVLHCERSPSTWRYPEWFLAGNPGHSNSLWRSECLQHSLCPIPYTHIHSACKMLALIVHVSTWQDLDSSKRQSPEHAPYSHSYCCDKVLWR